MTENKYGVWTPWVESGQLQIHPRATVTDQLSGKAYKDAYVLVFKDEKEVSVMISEELYGETMRYMVKVPKSSALIEEIVTPEAK